LTFGGLKNQDVRSLRIQLRALNITCEAVPLLDNCVDAR